MNNYGHQPPHHSHGSAGDASVLAWITCILGVSAWFVAPFIAAIAALICGSIEKKNIQNGLSSPAGTVLVKIGTIAAIVNLALIGLAILAVFGFFAFMFLIAIL